MFEIDKLYNFSTIAPVTLSENYKNMKVLGEVTFQVAIQFTDVVTTRNKIIKETGTELLDPKIVKYVILKNEDGDRVILGLDWIVTDSIIMVDSVDATIVIPNINSEDLVIIKNAILALGHKNLTITTN